ncbi:MAG: C39 family peptidase, partial [Ruminococcus sp.]|nr:C39 family peptidase [Ruminococcus sp.]
ITAAAAALTVLCSCGETVRLMGDSSEPAAIESTAGAASGTATGAPQETDTSASEAEPVTEPEPEPTTVDVYDKSFELPASSVLDGFETVLQKPEFPTGCEVTSLTETLNYLGFGVDKVTLADEFMPIDYNGYVLMNEAYIGDPRTDGFGCNANVIVQTADMYFASVDSPCCGVDLTGTEYSDLWYQIAAGRPVIVWVTIDMRVSYPEYVWTAGNGEDFIFDWYQHCITLYGYDLDEGIVYAADPLVGNTTYPIETFAQIYDIMGKQAVVIAGDASSEGHHTTTEAEKSVTMHTRKQYLEEKEAAEQESGQPEPAEEQNEEN